jgi:hypothetical protein
MKALGAKCVWKGARKTDVTYLLIIPDMGILGI